MDWRRLKSFIGNSKTELLDFLTQNSHLSKSTILESTKVHKDMLIIRIPLLAIEIHCQSNKIIKIFLYSPFLYLKFYQKCKPQELPLFVIQNETQIGKIRLFYHLNWEMKGKDIISFFGEPTAKSNGSGKGHIRMAYLNLGLEFELDSKTWENPDCGINFILLFIPRTDPKFRKCVICLSEKPDLKICSQCKVTYYCKKQCQNLHWKVHKTHCKQFKKIN